jgi:hypothetical protein
MLCVSTKFGVVWILMCVLCAGVALRSNYAATGNGSHYEDPYEVF